MTRTRLTAVGVVLVLTGLVAFVSAFVVAGVLPLTGEVGLLAVGWGPFLGVLTAGGSAALHENQRAMAQLLVHPAGVEAAWRGVAVGVLCWVGGWLVLARALNDSELARSSKLPASSSTLALFPRLANARDFHWGTLAAYGFGLFFAEAALIALHLVLVGKGEGSFASPLGIAALVIASIAFVIAAFSRTEATRTRRLWSLAIGSVLVVFRIGLKVAALAGLGGLGLPPAWAFLLALVVASVLAFGAGFLGASNARRLSIPELTIAFLYFGLPIPFFLTLMHHVSWLMLNVGYRLREIVYLSSLLGENRPELGYWLVTAALALFVFLGINLGFVATSSGRFDLRTSYESFVASRHVAVFRPRLLIGAFLVLIFGIVPPLILLAIVSAAENATNRTRVKRLGLADPLRAAEALHAQKLGEQTPTAMMTALSVGGVGVGVMALIIVLSVMSGFEADLQKKILGTNSHGVVMKYTPEMPEYAEVLEKIHQVRGITGATPFILNEVMVSSEGNISGSMIKGIDPATVGSVTDLPSSLGCDPSAPCHAMDALEDPALIRAKRLDPTGTGALDERPATPDSIIRDPLIELAPEKAEPDAPPLPGIIVGKELASSLKVVVGDRLNVVSPLGGELGPQGPVPKSRPFRVAGIFYSGMFEYDSKFVYIHLREAQTFFGIKGASGVEVKVDDVDNARGIMKRIYDSLDGYPYRTKDWGEMNRNLFAALRLEKLVMAIILTIIIIVAAGLIVATVIMLVLEKRKEIAVLKALGVPDGGIVKIFLAEGLQIGIAGGVLGLISGLAWCLFIEKVGIKLDPQVYYIPALPVRIVPLQTILAVVIAILVTFLASVYPALKASQVEPVEGLKSE